MTRKLVVLLFATGLVLAPAASAKGPHAVISSGPDAVDAGRPWTATLNLNEFRQQSPHARVVATQGARRAAVRLRRVEAAIPGAASFRMRIVFPTEGPWRLTVVAAKRHFDFPALEVGGGQPPRDWVSFPKGSYAERQGAGGEWGQGPDIDPAGRGTPLPPEVVSTAAKPPSDDGFPLWIPGLGLALVGAGVGLGAVKRR